MKKVLGAICGLALAATVLPARAADDDMSKRTERLDASARTLNEIMAAPDKGIPAGILSKAHCVIVIPGDKKLAFAVGGNYGRGVATCRTGHGWSAPIFMTLGGGSFGFQIGGQSTDLVLLGMNAKSAQDMLHSKVKLGADASAAAGPVGRNAQADTGILLNAEFLSYSRAKGLFAGLDLSGAFLGQDNDEDKKEYGDNVNADAILDGQGPVPANARQFVHTVARYFVESR